MTRRTATRLAWGLWALAMVLAAVAVVFLVASWSTPPPEGSFGFRGFALIFAVTFGTVGAVVASRQSANPIGWLLLLAAVASGFQELASQYAVWSVLAERANGGLGEIAAWIPAWIWIPATSIAMLALYLFPDGHLLSPRWSWGMGAGVAGMVIGSIGFALVPGPLENFSALDNPFGVASRGTMTSVALAGMLAQGIAYMLAAASAFLRFRRSTGEEHQQMRWLAASGVFLALSLVASYLELLLRDPNSPQQTVAAQGMATSLMVIVGFASLPVAMGFAILKYRLYDLDVVIRKTVVFGILVALLTAVFLIGAVAVGGTVARKEPGRSALPTLTLAFLIGALTIPLWRLSRRIADRLVFGGRATPYEVLSKFADRVGETYSAEDVLPRMAQVLGAALGADDATVWLGLHDGYRLAAVWPTRPLTDADPPDDMFEVRHQGELLGALGVRQPANDPMNPSKEQLARDLAAQAGPVLRNVRLIEELRASRRRIVTAQDERAKQIERNLHDGAQQQLIALGIKVNLAKTLAAKDAYKATALLEGIQGELQESIDTLRDLARGIYPPLLADQGLAAALEAQARKAAVLTTVRDNGIGRYPQDVESAAYFCCLEALQNVSKYANAASATISLRADDRSLTFTVTDDGDGFDTTMTNHGTGMQGMADRLDAIGGSLSIQSTPGKGTTVTGRIPATETRDP